MIRYTVTIPADHGLDSVAWLKIGRATKKKPLEGVALTESQVASLRAKGFQVEESPEPAKRRKAAAVTDDTIKEV
jgi:hypothetical protein